MSAAEDVPMFEVDVPTVDTPPRSKGGSARPRWSRYKTRSPVKCDDCMLVLALAKGDGPVSRLAQFRRAQGGTDLLLCAAHAQVRRDEDGLEPLKP